MASIHIKGIEKKFGTPDQPVIALSPIDLDISDGEFVVLLGPSGCGKTTLLRCIGELLKPTSGTIEIGTADTAGVRSTGQAAIGMAFQDANLFPWLTIEENIALPLRLGGVGRAERLQKAHELCALVSIQGFEKRWPRELSGGMRQRAAIARALSHNPDILLLDEPFGALDAMTRDQMNVELQRIWLNRQCTVVLVTHSITEAAFLADRVVSMSPRPGRITQITPIPFARPRDLDIASTPEFQRIASSLRHLIGVTEH